MAITRQKFTQQSRQLRSRAIPLTRPAASSALASHRKSIRQGGGKQTLSTPKASNKGSQHLPTGTGRCANFEIGREESTNDHISSDEGSKPVNDFKEGPTLHPADTNAAAEEIDPELAVNLNMEKAAAIFEDVGLPEDDQWDLIAAHEYRFCSQHGEVEWLLEYADRWMHSSDFGSEWAETALEAGLQKYQSRHNGDNMSPRSAQADCVDGLWSQVDTPIQKGVFDGKAVYLVRWKLRWTSERDIDNDNGWVQASFQSQNERRNRRRSPRAELAPTDVTRKIEGMMRVINIEDLL